MNPSKIIIVLLFIGGLFYFMDGKRNEEKLSQEIAALQQQVEAKDKAIEQQKKQTSDAVEKQLKAINQQVEESRQQSKKIDEQINDLNAVTEDLVAKQKIEKNNRAAEKALRKKQQQMSEEALKAAYISEGFQAMSALKQQIAEYYLSNERFPRSNKDLGIAKPNRFATQAVKSVWVSRGGRITVVYTEKSGIDKGAISLTPKAKNGMIHWSCRSKDFKNISSYFPQCQYEGA